MKTTKRALAALIVLLAIRCASVGAADPLLVRAEDLLSNSLAVYDGAMRYHFVNSTKETPQVYKIMESVRTQFPPAWKALYDGTRAYKTSPDPTKLGQLMAAVQAMIDSLSSVSATTTSELWLELAPDRIGG